MGLPHERAAFLGLAAEPAHFGAEVLDDALPFARALAEHLLEPARLAVGGGVLIAVDAVDQRGDQRVQSRNFVLTVSHGHAPAFCGLARTMNA